MTFINSASDKALDELRLPSAVNIIFGAGYTGAAALDTCLLLGIRVAYFCDNNPGKTLFCGLPVILPEKAAENAEANFLLAVTEVGAVLEQLKTCGVDKAFSMGLLTRHPHSLLMPSGFGKHFADYHSLKHCVSRQQHYLEFVENSAVSLPCLDIVITEHCTLKCRNCSTLMPYYQKSHHPRHRPVTEVMDDIDAFSSCVDHITEVVLIGGESLLHPEFHVIAARIAEKSNVGMVCILTNGTLLPSEKQWSFLGSEKIYFRVSDYGKFSTRINELIAELERRNMRGYRQTYERWTRFGFLPRRKLDASGLESLFSACQSKYCFPLRDGKLYRCEFAPNALRLGAIPDEAGNSVDLSPVLRGEISPREFAPLIGAFAFTLDSMPACDYCFGYTENSEAVPPAEQCTSALLLPQQEDA